MTVSRVVNTSPPVSELMGQRIPKAVHQLGYAPHPTARNLASARSEWVGLLYGNPSTSYLSDVLVGALDAAARHSVPLVRQKSEPRAAISRRVLQRLLAGRVIGVVLPPPSCESLVILAELKASAVAAVAVERRQPSEAVTGGRIDDFIAACAMTRYLARVGGQAPRLHQGSSQSKHKRGAGCADFRRWASRRARGPIRAPRRECSLSAQVWRRPASSSVPSRERRRGLQARTIRRLRWWQQCTGVH